jgi:predicted nucleic acid-binding protein
MNGGYLLDTNIPSETLRPCPDAKVVAWLERYAKIPSF